MRDRDLRKTIEQLDQDVWPAPDYDSYLVQTCHALRKKPLNEFTTEDLRIMIGQSIGLRHLVPTAIDRLKADPLAEGDFYPGDLMCALLTSDPGYWTADKPHRLELEAALARARTAIQTLPAAERGPVVDALDAAEAKFRSRCG